MASSQFCTDNDKAGLIAPSRRSSDFPSFACRWHWRSRKTGRASACPRRPLGRQPIPRPCLRGGGRMSFPGACRTARCACRNDAACWHFSDDVRSLRVNRTWPPDMAPGHGPRTLTRNQQPAFLPNCQRGPRTCRTAWPTCQAAAPGVECPEWCRGVVGAVMSRLLLRAAVPAVASRMVIIASAIGLALSVAGCARKGDIYATDPELREISPARTTGGAAGGTVTLYGSPASLGPHRSETVRPFVRTGLHGDFSNEQSASFQNFGGASANGSLSVSHSMTIPVLAGISIPASRIGLNAPGLTTEIFGGVQVTRRKASLQLTEALAPGGPATSASTSWTSIDPALGAAVMYHVGNIDTRPVTVGPSVTVNQMRSHNFTATSANFPATETYVVNTGSRTEARVMFNVNVGVNSMVSAGATAGLTR